MGTHNGSEMVAVPGTHCAIPHRNSNARLLCLGRKRHPRHVHIARRDSCQFHSTWNWVSRQALRCTHPPIQWISGVKRSRGVKLITHPHLVLRSRMSRSYTSSPPCRLYGGSGAALLMYLYWCSFLSSWDCVLVLHGTLLSERHPWKCLICTFGSSTANSKFVNMEELQVTFEWWCNDQSHFLMMSYLPRMNDNKALNLSYLLLVYARLFRTRQIYQIWNAWGMTNTYRKGNYREFFRHISIVHLSDTYYVLRQ
jgi:hypothetical protein